MSQTSFYLFFGVTWLIAMAYGLSAFRLLLRVRHLKREGKAEDAPDPLTNSLDIFRYLGWLLGGRYGELRDDVVRRWSGIARSLFIIAAPLILAMFAFAFTVPGVLDR